MFCHWHVFVLTFRSVFVVVIFSSRLHWHIKSMCSQFTALNVEFSIKVSLWAGYKYQLWKHPPHYKATIISFTSRHPLVINHSDSVAKVAYQNQNNRALYWQMNCVHCSGVWNSINWVRTKFKRQPMSMSLSLSPSVCINKNIGQKLSFSQTREYSLSIDLTLMFFQRIQ